MNVVQEFLTLVTTYPYVLMATVSGGLFALVAITSIKAARRKLAYETWYGLHLYAYLAIALGFLHQLFVGADFMHDQLAAIYWILLYVATVALILAFRIGQPIRTSLRHRLRVANVVHEGPGVVSLYLTGRDLDRLPVRAGQYFLWRFLTPDGWWRSHPFSISAAPNGEWLRITVKDLGDGSRDSRAGPDRHARDGRGAVRRSSPTSSGPSPACSSSPAASASRRSARCSRPCRPGPATSPCSTARGGRRTSSSATSSRSWRDVAGSPSTT